MTAERKQMNAKVRIKPRIVPASARHSHNSQLWSMNWQGQPYAQLQLVKSLALIIQLTMGSSSLWRRRRAVEAFGTLGPGCALATHGYHISNFFGSSICARSSNG